MSKEPDIKRVQLDESGQAAVSEMLSRLKLQEPCIKINTSKLVNWILGEYLNSSFEKHRDLIVKSHFNSKEYLKKALTAASSQGDLENAIESVLQRLRDQNTPARKERRKVRSSIDRISDSRGNSSDEVKSGIETT